MLRRLTASLILFAAVLSAGLWPEQWGDHRRAKAEPLEAADRPLFDEYGGKQAEKATYDGPAGRFSASAWQMEDATGAVALYQALRPANAVPQRGALLASTTPSTLLAVYKNYVLLFDGWRPTSRELEQLGGALPGLRNVAPPALPAYLPEQGLVRNSERYILGLVSLSRFVPAFKPELAGFEVSGEAQYARYRVGEAEVPVIVFAYPTPQVATQQARQFEQQGNLVVRRTSSLVALAMDAPDRAAAAQLIAGLHYEANFMWNQATQPPRPPNVAGMLVAIFELTGLLLVICVLGGIGFAFLWYYLRKRDAALRGDEATMIRLNI